MRAVVVCCLLAACGDNAVVPDARPIDAVDAPVDTPPPPAGCDWGELFDTTNHTEPEPTGLAFASRLVFCGQVDPGHAVSTTMLVDDDAFGFSVATMQRVRVELAGDFGGLAVELAITNRFGDPIATSTFVGSHAVTAATLPPGSYGVAVHAVGAEPAAPIAYRVTASADDSTCMVTSAAAFTESANDNDVVEVRFTGDPAQRRVLTSAADTPEPTGIVVTAPVRITGTSAVADAPDDYRDRDTFAFTTGASTDTLAVRVDWAAPGVDLDVFVFPDGTPAELASATHVSTTGPETLLLAVAPSTAYWLWIGSYDASTGLPTTYDVSLCAP